MYLQDNIKDVVSGLRLGMSKMTQVRTDEMGRSVAIIIKLQDEMTPSKESKMLYNIKISMSAFSIKGAIFRIEIDAYDQGCKILPINIAADINPMDDTDRELLNLIAMIPEIQFMVFNEHNTLSFHDTLQIQSIDAVRQYVDIADTINNAVGNNFDYNAAKESCKDIFGQ